jgi:flagellar basal-body rod protein FlgC
VTDRTTDLNSVLGISGAGMAAQSTRLRVIAENVANQDSTGSAPGAAPYQRKTVTFANGLDRALGVDLVKVGKIGHDSSAFPLRYDPSHPAADANGYVRTPNVNSFIEVMDMREAERSYSANLAVMQSTRGMLERTIEMLK